MKVHILVENSSEFMSHDVTEYLMASTNRKNLYSVLRKCQILAPNSDFSIETVFAPTRTYSEVMYLHQHDSDWNYCQTHDYNPFFASGEQVETETAEVARLPILRSITKEDMGAVFARMNPEYVRELTEHFQVQKLKKTGEYWQKNTF